MDNSRSKEDHRGYRHPFISGVLFLRGVGDEPRTLVELAMCQLSALIRSSENWWLELREPEFRDRWLAYSKNHTWIVKTSSRRAEVQLGEKQVTYILDELAGYSALRDKTYGCQVSCFERIWQSDSALDRAVIARLERELSKVSPCWQETVRACIIDPSPYCLIYNKTQVSHHNGRVYIPVSPPPSEDVHSNFALLPSDIFIPSDVSDVRFTSYINNLHPDLHKHLYHLLERLLTTFIPLFEYSLTDLHRNNPLHLRIPGGCNYIVWEEPDPPLDSDDEEGWAEYTQSHRKWELTRPLNLPDVPAHGYPGGLEARRHKVSLRGQAAQVFVRVYTISLDPDKHATFPGLPWHVEGMRAERIVANGLYCLSNDNLSEPVVQFRMAVTYPRAFAAGDEGATLRTWGLGDEDPCHQYIGEVKLLTGRSLVFPNIYQYSIRPIDLVDSGKTGSLTLVFFHLVDPEVQPIISTSSVGPQQQEWIFDAIYDALKARLPTELIEQVAQNVDGLLTVDEAMSFHKEFLETQRRFTASNNNSHFCLPFDVWTGHRF